MLPRHQWARLFRGVSRCPSIADINRNQAKKMTPNTADPPRQYRSPGFTYQSNPTSPSQMTAPTIVTA